MTDHADRLLEPRRRRLPVTQQIVEHRVQTLLRWVPGLQEIVIESHPVDRVDRRLRVRVRRQQHALCIRHHPYRSLERLDAAQPGHPLISHDQRNSISSQSRLLQRRERLLTRLRPHDPIAARIPATQITLDRPHDPRLVVNRENDRPIRHAQTLRTGQRATDDA